MSTLKFEQRYHESKVITQIGSVFYEEIICGIRNIKVQNKFSIHCDFFQVLLQMICLNHFLTSEMNSSRKTDPI